MRTSTARLTYVWLFLSAITVLSCWLGHSAHSAHHLVASTPVTIGVLAIGLVKSRLILQQFMEVRTAPTWLRRFTDGWLVLFWTTVLAIYLY
jgi:cytochrome c oxidase subunit 4